MWYDATSAAGSLEASDSPVKGKIGYVQAPVKETKSSGWLYAWSWAIEKKSQQGRTTPGSSSPGPRRKKYEDLVGAQDGWATVPGRQARLDLRQRRLPQGRRRVRRADQEAPSRRADPTNPGVQPRPTVGIQFVDIPEFTDFGTKVSPGRRPR